VSLTASLGKWLGIFSIILLIPFFCLAQSDSTSSSHLSKKQKTNRQIFIGAVNVVGYGGSLIILSNTWYKNYPHSSFHTFNDAGEWLQVDKFGHGWTAYNTGRLSAAMWRW